jgi:hypothetical protein
MREDMAQVVVERPRHGSSARYHEVRPRGIARHDLHRLADLPRFEGMRRPHVDRKSQSDLLGPLRKFLTRQVGRPWNKVYSEIRERISPNSTIELHILGHLEQFIEMQTVIGPDGRVCRAGRHYSWRRVYLDECPGQLYVHPRTGIIRRTPEARASSKRRAAAAEVEFKAIGPERELWRRDGVWYWAIFATATPRSLFDAARCEAWTAYPTDEFTGHRAALGARYRAGKRQTSSRDLRRYGLANKVSAE